MQLSEATREEFERDGYCVVRNFVSDSWCTRLAQRIEQLTDAFDPGDHPSVFTTHEQTRTSDAYFLGSGDSIRFFLEEEAVDDAGAMTVPQQRAINKIGHALHRLDPVFEAFGTEHRLEEVAGTLGCDRPLAIQSMAILKPPGIGGEVTWHQDATFLYTDPVSVVGLWFAIDDATLDNGCLWAIPGGHRGPLRQRFVRDGPGTTFVPLAEHAFRTEHAQPIEVPRGTLVALHGLLPHRSDANRSPLWRHAYSVHVIDREADYPASNWLRFANPPS